MNPDPDEPKDPERWIRQFPRAAKQRFATAQFLREHGYNVDAMYLAGYAVECAFKAVILEKTPRNRRGDTLTDITSGKESHNIEHLRHLLRTTGYELPLATSLSVREIAKAKWSTAWRYEVGYRSTKEARGFLEQVAKILEWMERSR